MATITAISTFQLELSQEEAQCLRAYLQNNDETEHIENQHIRKRIFNALNIEKVKRSI